ncbi:hypothetical protein N7478_010540 [Penicillium angulare]|uniref:uncharacterized protein n=1 Tax=Penicillium angulare TaxID=116970 RepID=UPI00254148FC|nr:uncharacterized protein N7478_010540 [Penicillium angulare]KAJ5267732.1 hypothetical protein N7478_010540 [Penicillium angulare]
MVSIIDFPTEILWIIASTLSGGQISAFAQTHRNLYPKLRLALIKYNIKHQNSSALHWAAKTNNCAFAKALISYRADVNALVDDSSPLMTAADHGSELVIKVLLQKRRLRVNLRNTKGESALWHSVATTSSVIVTQLLQHPQLKVDLPNSEGQTVLWLAVFQGNRDFVCQLLIRGANPDTKDLNGISPWIQACIRNRNNIKDLLLDHWKATSPGVISQDTPLTRSEETVASAAGSGGASISRMLRLRGEEFDIVDEQGLTPLHTAARSGHLLAVDFLLRHANTLLNRKDSYGRTALWWSTFSFYDRVTQRLLEEKDVEINTLGTCGKYDSPSTSLHHLARRNDTTVLGWFLSRPSLDPNLCGGSQSPLCLAIQQGNTAVVRLLLTHKKTQINALEIPNDSPLLLATQEGHRDMVELLVRQGDRLQINQWNSPDKETALCVAIRHGRLDILDILLGHPGINIDTINGWGETALLLAVKREDTAMVSRLLQGPNLPCILAMPAEVAQSRKKRDMSRLIQEAMKQKSHGDYSSRKRQRQIRKSRVNFSFV